ncbi:hypothetical protein B0H13DRAFT_1591819, partial [Mycena leptocephala]
QEFRELELLNEISELRYRNRLPASVKRLCRCDLIHAYQEIKGVRYEPADLHEAVRWRQHEDRPIVPAKIPSGKWELVGADMPKKIASEKGKEHPAESRGDAALVRCSGVVSADFKHARIWPKATKKIWNFSFHASKHIFEAFGNFVHKVK